MYPSAKSKPRVCRPTKNSNPAINVKTNGSVQVPMNVVNDVTKLSKLSKVSIIPANFASKQKKDIIDIKTDKTKFKSIKLKGISIPALYNIGEIDKLKEDMSTDLNKKTGVKIQKVSDLNKKTDIKIQKVKPLIKEDVSTDLNQKTGIKIQKVKPLIQQKTIRSNDEVNNSKSFTTSNVDRLDHKNDSVQRGIQGKEDKDEEDSDLIKNIRQIIQQKSDSINQSETVKDIKPVINNKLSDVNLAPATNSKPIVQHIIDSGDDDDSDIEIEEINIVSKTKESEATSFPEAGSVRQEEFIKTIMMQVEELEATLGSQIKQKNESLLKEREINEQLKRKNSILELKEQERKLSTENYDQKTDELSKKVEKQQKAIEILKDSLKLKDEECKSAIEKHEQLKQKNSILELKEQERKLSTEKYDQKIGELSKKVEKQQKAIVMLKDGLNLKDEERKSAVEKYESMASELSQKLLSKEKDIKMLNDNRDIKEREIKLEIEKRENKTKEILKEVSQKNIEIDLLNKKFDQVSDDLKNLKKVSDKQIKTVKESSKRLLDKHSKETATLHKQISVLEKSNKESNESIVDLNDTIDSLNKKLAKKGDLVSELKLKVSKLISEFTKGYKDKDDQIDSKSKRIQEMNDKAESLATKVSDLQNDVAIKVNEIHSLKQEKETTDSNIASLKQELSTKENDLATKVAMNSRQGTLIADLSKTVTNLENNIAAKDKEVLSLKKDLTVKVNDLETKNVMNKRQSSLLGEISKNLDDLTKAKNNLEKSHTIIKMVHQALSTKFQNLEQTYKQTCFVKKQLQDRLNKIKIKAANKIDLTDDEIFEDKLEQTFYNSKRKEGLSETLMITYNWPVLSVKVDPRVLMNSKNEDKKIVFKQYYVQGSPLMVTYLWPIVSRGTGRGYKRRNEDNQDNFMVNKKLRITEEGKKALYNFKEEEMEDLLMFTCNVPVLSVHGDLNIFKAAKCGVDNFVSQRDANTRPLMLTYLWPVVPFHTMFEANTPVLRGLKRTNEENDDGSVSSKMMKVSIEAGTLSFKRKLLEETSESKRIKLDRKVIEEEHVADCVSEFLQCIINDILGSSKA